jgi:aldose sugar dehydrogenase
VPRVGPPILSRVARLLAGAVCGCCLALALSGCLPGPPLTVSTVVSGVDRPWDLGFAGITLIYTERPGRISAFVDGQKRLLAAPTDVYRTGEAGMMGLAIDPAFSTNRFIYTCFASTLGGTPGDVRLVRWRVNPDFTALTNRTDIVTGMPLHSTGRHSGCRPRFDPTGILWVGTGDSASGGVAQDPRSLGGKILRVTRDGSPAPGNPGGALDPRIFSYGHRNVQGIAFRPSDSLGVSTEHGPDRDDELNRLLPGNFGWDPVFPNGQPGYNESVPMTDLQKFPGAVRAEWSSGVPTVAPSGATFLSGSRWRDWNGAVAIALLKGSKLLVVGLNAQGHLVDVGVSIGNQGRLRSPVQGPDGNLYLSTDNGGGNDRILRIVPG